MKSQFKYIQADAITLVLTYVHVHTYTNMHTHVYLFPYTLVNMFMLVYKLVYKLVCGRTRMCVCVPRYTGTTPSVTTKKILAGTINETTCS